MVKKLVIYCYVVPLMIPVWAWNGIRDGWREMHRWARM